VEDKNNQPPVFTIGIVYDDKGEPEWIQNIIEEQLQKWPLHKKYISKIEYKSETINKFYDAKNNRINPGTKKEPFGYLNMDLLILLIGGKITNTIIHSLSNKKTNNLKNVFPDVFVFEKGDYKQIEIIPDFLKLIDLKSFLLETQDNIKGRYARRELLYHLQRCICNCWLHFKNKAENIIIDNDEIDEIIEKISKNPPDRLLINGDSGVGKEKLVRKLVHKYGKEEVIEVSCAEIRKERFEADFSGWRKGSHDSAIENRKGHLEIAHKKILFLDEVAEIPMSAQGFLLRALQERKIRPIGGEEVDCDFKLICATNRNLEEMVKEEKFRADLFYRMGLIKLNLPPLKEREKAKIQITEEIFQRLCIKFNYYNCQMDKNLTTALADKKFTGDLRGLEAVLEKIISISGNRLIERNKDIDKIIKKHELRSS
jgi:transcriptional regulator with PAS, ATPase and Fis domain